MANNTILRHADGKFQKGVSASPEHKITSDNARVLASARWEKYRQAAVQRVIEEGRGIDPNVQGGADAWALLVSKQYIALMDSDKPRGDDLKAIGQVIGAMPMSHEVAQEQAGQAVTLSLSSAGLDRLVSLLGMIPIRQDIIDADEV